MTEKQFIINNKDIITKIMEEHLLLLERKIRKEEKIDEKIKLSAVANYIDGWISIVKNSKYNEPIKGEFTGI